MAQAAGEFLNAKLFKHEEDAPVVKTAKGKKRGINTPLIRDLVQFFIESEVRGAVKKLQIIGIFPCQKDS